MYNSEAFPSDPAQRFLNSLELGESKTDPFNRTVERLSSDTVEVDGAKMSDGQYLTDYQACEDAADDDDEEDFPEDDDEEDFPEDDDEEDFPEDDDDIDFDDDEDDE